MKQIRLFFIFLSMSAALCLQAQDHSIIQELSAVMSRVSTERLRADIETLAGFHTRNTFSDTLSPTTGIGAARRWLYRAFCDIAKQSGGRMTVEQDGFFWPVSGRYREAFGIDSIWVVNVVAVIHGSASERVLHINGHYDSRTYSGTDIEGFAPGANDDGSGTAALLELARILSKRPLRNTVVLAAVAGEEQGLMGSRHMAAEARKTGLLVEGVIANDMIGNIKGGDGQTSNTMLRCFSPDPSESPSRNWALYLNRVSRQYVPDISLKMIFRLDRFGRGGDHSPFVNEGFAGVRFTEPYENYTIQHSPDDISQNMSFDYLTKTVRLNAALAAYWADAPAAPEIVSISRDSIYQTVITFLSSEDPKILKGFRLFTRETDQGYWTESHLVQIPEPVSHPIWGEVYQIRLVNRDQDYYNFGLAAVNRSEYESIATTYDRAAIREKIRQMRESKGR